MPTTFSKEVDERFKKIRINFLFHHPFLSVLALSLPTIYRSNERSAFQTDGGKLFIDPRKLERYGAEELTYLYAHTLLHVVLKHPGRRKTRDKTLWNQACDVVINNILQEFTNIGQMPRDEITDEQMQKRCVEEVYEILYKKQKKRGGQKRSAEQTAKTTPRKGGAYESALYHPHKRDLDPVSKTLDHGSSEKLDGIIVQALSVAKKTSPHYEGLQIEIDSLIKPEISLYDTLKEFLIASLFEKQSSYARPNRRFIHAGLYLPGQQKSQESLQLYIALDSSSSVTLEEYRKFLGVIEEICGNFYEYFITVLPFDRRVKTEHVIRFDSFNPLQKEQLFIPKSDGGTDFDALLRHVKQSSERRSHNLLLTLTDGEFAISESLPCQTLFLISEKKNTEKFKAYGRVIQFNL